MKIKTLNTFSVVTLPLAPCQTKWFQNEIDLSETELNPLAPCQTEWFQNIFCNIVIQHKTFGTMSNRMVPKQKKMLATTMSTFGTMSNRMVPKQFWVVNRLLETFGTMSNRMVPKPRIFYLT